VSELDDGRLPEAVSPDLPPTVDYEESSNIACYDCRKQDVLPLCPLSPKITKLIQGPSFSYKDYNTPARLGELTDSKLLSLGVSDKEDRRLVLSALNAAGYRAIAVTTAKHQDAKKRRIANRTPGAKDDNDDEDENSTSLSREPSTVIIRLRLPIARQLTGHNSNTFHAAKDAAAGKAFTAIVTTIAAIINGVITAKKAQT